MNESGTSSAIFCVDTICFYREKLYKLLEFVSIIKPREKGEPPSANIYTDL